MILSDYYKFQKLTASIYRYDAKDSTGSYDTFERLLINKARFNIGGLSLNYVDRPSFGKVTRPGKRRKRSPKGQ